MEVVHCSRQIAEVLVRKRVVRGDSERWLQLEQTRGELLGVRDVSEFRNDRGETLRCVEAELVGLVVRKLGDAFPLAVGRRTEDLHSTEERLREWEIQVRQV